MTTANSDPLFSTVGEALVTAFGMEFTSMSVRGSTQSLIEDLMEQRYGKAADAAPRDPRVNRGDLKPIELRAQSAMIRAQVEGHLKGVERAAIHARFGHQTTRGNGVHELAQHYGSLCTTGNQSAIKALLWGIYAPGVRQRPDEGARAFNLRRSKRESEWSLRAIEKSYGCSKSTLHRDQQLLRKVCGGTETVAQNKMEDVFIRAGLILDPNDA
jgi:hypothetical protein